MNIKKKNLIKYIVVLDCRKTSSRNFYAGELVPNGWLACLLRPIRSVKDGGRGGGSGNLPDVRCTRQAGFPFRAPVLRATARAVARSRSNLRRLRSLPAGNSPTSLSTTPRTNPPPKKPQL